jgi:branched-chain amino acid transport system substrate-binding protein
MVAPVLRSMALVLAAAFLLPTVGFAFQEEGTLRIGGVWALSGGVALTGKGALSLTNLAIEEVNASGVVIGGKRVKMVLHAHDDACNAEQGLAIVRRLATVDKVLFSLGPTCSSTAEPAYKMLQKRLDDPGDTGLPFLFFTDTASKFGLAKISPWVFRNTVDEPMMYDFIVGYLKERFPALKTVAVAWEPDFAHSASTWKLAVKPALDRHKYHQIAEVVEWGWQDTDYTAQVGKLARTNADIYFTLTHEPTTCPSFRELRRQGVRPKAIVAISSLAGATVLLGCPDLAEGMIVPTNFAPLTAKAKELEKKAWDRFKAESNLDRSHTAYEIIYLMKDLIEKTGIKNTEESLLEDRRKLRDALARIGTFQGMVGPITLNPDDHPVKPREAEKAMFLLQVKNAQWTLLWAPPGFVKSQ